jgi:hypothetical protein
MLVPVSVVTHEVSVDAGSGQRRRAPGDPEARVVEDSTAEIER